MPLGEALSPPAWRVSAERYLGRGPSGLRDGDSELAGVCLQQAVDKVLKAFLLARGWKLRRIHDLETLLDAATAFAPEMDVTRKDLWAKVTAMIDNGPSNAPSK